MDDSPLGKLPPELRNHVYELVFTPKVDINIRIDSATYPSAPIEKQDLSAFDGWSAFATTILHPTTEPKRRPRPALTRICKQIREETKQISYSRPNAVSFSADTYLISRYRKDDMYRFKEESQDTHAQWPDDFVAWCRQITQTASLASYAIRLDVGTLNTKETDYDKFRALQNLVYMVRLLSPSAELFVELTVRNTMQHMEYTLHNMTLQGHDLQASKAAILEESRSRSQRLRQQWLDGSLSTVSYSEKQAGLQKCRNFLGWLVASVLQYPPEVVEVVTND